MYRIIIALIVAAVTLVVPARHVPAAPGDNYVNDDALSSARLQWWKDARFGMFIHWGLYAAYRGQHGSCNDAEWIKRNCNIPMADYEAKATQWNPTSYDANAIVQLAKQAGQKYIVITSKHHDGFAMWPTAVNNWNIRSRTPFQRDPLREFADAARANGIRFGVYYSIWDWHDPDFNTNFPAYLGRAKAQLNELVSNYDLDLLWFDGEWDGATNPPNPFTSRDGEALEQYVRGLKPGIVVNNRVSKRRPVDGDYGTPEQVLAGAPPKAQLLESCMTINGTWGYAVWDTNFKSPHTLTRNLLYLTSNGSNFLLNIGPTDTGAVTTGQADALRGMGSWLSVNGAAVHGASFTGLVNQPSWGRITRKANKLYLAVYNWGPVHVSARSPFSVTGARVLGSSQGVTVTASGDGFDFTPSGSATSPIATVIEADISPQAPAPAGTGTGLRAEFWNNNTFSGTPVSTRVDPTVNYAWRWSGSPASNVNTDNFSSRWTGQVQPRFSEAYTFTTASDDTVQLWVNGQLIISNTTPHGIGEDGTGIDQGTITLTAGVRYDIRLQHTENGGEAYMKLIWSSPNTPAQVVPTSQMYPTSAGAIVGVASNRCVDIPGANPVDGRQLILWDCHGGANQAWTFPGDGTVRSMSKCLTSESDLATIRACNGGAGQQWTYNPATQQLLAQGKCLDASGGGTGNNTPLILWPCHGNGNQKWRISGS